MLWLLTGDPALEGLVDDAYGNIVIAASDHVMPDVVRAIFLAKGDGYTFWANIPVTQGGSRTPNAFHTFNGNPDQIAPWRAIGDRLALSMPDEVA